MKNKIRKLDTSLVLGVILAAIALVLGGLLLFQGKLLEGFSVMIAMTSAVWLTSSVLDRIDAMEAH
jgi:Mg/Co/Ni transporter MgtE